MIFFVFMLTASFHFPSAPTFNSNTTSINVSWSPPKSTPVSYRISYSCQLICGSLVTHQNTSVVEPFTTHIIVSATPGSRCSVDVMAIFNASNNNNKVTSLTNTASEGMVIQTNSAFNNYIYLT